MTAHAIENHHPAGSARRPLLAVLWGVLRRLVTWAAFMAAFASVGLSVGVTVWAKVVNHGAYVVYVTSNSMKPSISAGDVLAVTPTQAKGLAVGQVVTMKRANGVLVTHRITSVDRAPGGQVTIHTKGDANKTADNDVAAGDQVLGTVRSQIPQLAETLNWVQSPRGRVVLLAPVFVLFFLGEFVNWWRKPEDDEPTASPAAADPAGDPQDEKDRQRGYKGSHRR